MKQPPPVQFRPGPILGRWLAELAPIWKVNENEVARRLAALAACRLDIGHVKLLQQLSIALTAVGSSPDFVRACYHVRTALDSANRVRLDLGNQPFNEPETLAYIQRIVREAASRKKARQAKMQQDQEITVKVHRTQ